MTALHDSDYTQLLSELRSANLDAEADALQAEVAREWESGSSTVSKRAKLLRTQTYLARTVSALRAGELASLTPTGHKFELAQSVVRALQGPLLAPAPAKAPVPADALSAALQGGTWVVLGFEDGEFSATADEVAGKGGTWEEALRVLAENLQAAPRAVGVERTGEVGPKSATEYSYVSRRKHRR
jgi:hypothetical protein